MELIPQKSNDLYANTTIDVNVKNDFCQFV